MQKLPVILFAIGCVTLVAVFIFGWIIVPSTIHSSIETEMSLTNGSVLWDEWINPDQETYIKIYIFNVTNTDEIESGGEPKVKELGPYVYKEVREKRILEENNDNDTLKYVESVTYFFDEILSNGTEDDTITIPNVPFVTVAQYLSTYASTYRWLASIYLAKFQSPVFVSRTVKDFLFSGTYEPMISEIEKLIGRLLLPNSTFGMFYGKNRTELDEIEIHSGIKDSSRLGEIISLNGKTELNYWTGAECNMINGTDGSLFSPFVTKEKKLHMYRPQACRSIYLTYKNDVEVRGIPGYRFAAPPSVFEAPEENTENRCFCNETDLNKCPKNGVYQISSCKDAAPISMSFPHFLYGDSHYIEKFGLSPKSELHECRVDLEPKTGVPLAVHKRFQVNVDIRRLSNNHKFQRIQDLVFPLIWIDESYIISEENVARIKSGLITSLEIINNVKWCTFVLGALLILASITIFWIRMRRKSVFV